MNTSALSWLVRRLAIGAGAFFIAPAAHGDGNVCDFEEQCWRLGRCIEGNDPDFVCTANRRSCSEYAACVDHGFCTFAKTGAPDKAPWCRPTAESCLASGYCQAFGRCFLGEELGQPACTVSSDAQCRETTACEEAGKCALGQLGPNLPICVPTLAGCEASEGCKHQARCDLDPEFGCIATDATACAATADCAGRGACDVLPSWHRCIPTTPEHCSASEACRSAAVCGFDAAINICVRTPEACAKSPACAERGECTAIRFGEVCSVGSPDHCAQSRVCRAFGACTFWQSHAYAPSSCQVTKLGEDYATMTNDKPMRIRKIAASSTQPRGKAYTYAPTNLTDGKLDTCWQPGASDTGGVGATLTIKLARKANVGLIQIANGFQRADALGDLFLGNNRVRYAFVTLGDGPKQLVQFAPNEREWSYTALDSRVTDNIVIEILEVYRGARWNDLAISEIAVFRVESDE